MKMPLAIATPSRLRRADRRGFTLIELLVVIAIIALLAAILFPVFARARENARKSSCQNNLKQIGVGALQYAQDYDEQLPFFFYGPDGGASTPDNVRYKWMDVVYPYIKSEQVFNCPSNGGKNPYRYNRNLPVAGSDVNYGSYGINVMYRYDVNPRTPPTGRSGQGLSLADLENPAGTIWFGDIASAGGRVAFGWSCLVSATGCTSIQPTNVVDTAVTPNQMENLVARHLDNVSITYADGHVKSLSLTQIAARRLSNGTLTDFTIQKD